MTRSYEVTVLEQSRPAQTSTESPVGNLVRDILAKVSGGMELANRMLPAECYTSQEFFEFERKEVFARSWICVGRVEQVANVGDCISAQPAGEPILVTR